MSCLPTLRWQIVLANRKLRKRGVWAVAFHAILGTEASETVVCEWELFVPFREPKAPETVEGGEGYLRRSSVKRVFSRSDRQHPDGRFRYPNRSHSCFLLAVSHEATL